jgi:rhodanese-related sulfurtransferase
MKLFPSSKIKQISAIEAEPLIERGEVVIVDVRRPQDYEESHVEGAILADKNTVHETIDPNLKDETVICYCYLGVSSRTAVKNLKKAGFTNVLNLKGGYTAWKHLEKPPTSF